MVVVGDQIEVRGPIGGYFVWEAEGATEPVLLVAGGSGVVPLMAMLRHRRDARSTVPAKLLYSSRTIEDVIYRDELDNLGADVVQTLTRAQPPGWTGYSRRVDIDMLRDVAYPPEQDPRVFVCGPTRFVEAVAEGLRIPLLKLYQAGVPNATFFALMRANVRLPEMFEGDLGAQLAACNTGARLLREMVAELGVQTVDAAIAVPPCHGYAGRRSAAAAAAWDT